MELLQFLTLIGLGIIIAVLVQVKEAVCQKLDEISRNLSQESSDQKEKSGTASIPGQIGQKLAEVQNKIQEKIQAGSSFADAARVAAPRAGAFRRLEGGGRRTWKASAPSGGYRAG